MKISSFPNRTGYGKLVSLPDSYAWLRLSLRLSVVLCFIMFFTFSLRLQAVPAYPRPMLVTQKDGTSLQVVLQGDEHAHCYFTLDGVPLVMGEDQSYYYATTMPDEASWEASSLLAHEASERTPEEQAFVALHAQPTSQVVRKVMTQRTQAANARRMARRKSQFAHPTNYVGDKKGLVILVNFSDLKMHSSTAQRDYDRMFNLEGCTDNDIMGSVSDYFRDQSYGKFRLTFDVVGPVTVSQPYSYYGKNTGGSTDINVRDMVVEACNLARGKVDFADYDWDNDGEVDQVFLIYAGYGEHWGGGANTIWPHESNLYDQALEIDGKKIDVYACASELWWNVGKYYAGIGTACHEFSHCLGLPDIYDVNYSGGVGMGDWDLMSGGSYAGHSGKGEAPCGYSAYERAFAGWLELKEISEPTVIESLPPIDEEPVAYVLYNAGNRDEYFILENRQSQGWFTYVSRTEGCHGMLITHVDYSESAWERNAINRDPAHQRLSFVPAGGEYGKLQTSGSTYRWYFSDDNYRSHLFPGKARVRTFDDVSHTDCGGKLFNANTDGSYALHLPVTHIKEENGRISFYVAGGRLLTTPEVLPASGVAEGTFVANWSAVSDAETYELELQDVEKANRPARNLLLKETFDYFRRNSGDGGFDDLSESVDLYMGTKGWSAQKLFTSPTGVKLGTTASGGMLLSPIFQPSRDSITVALTAASVDVEGAKLRVSTETDAVADDGEASCSLTPTHTPLVVHLPCSPNASLRVKWEADKRTYVDSVAIYDGRYEPADLSQAETDSEESTSVYRDLQETSYVLAQLGARQYRYRVRAVAGDFFSPWSQYQSVQLPAAESAVRSARLDADEAEVFYTISGLRLSARPVAPGVYLLQRAGKVTKVAIAPHSAH